MNKKVVLVSVSLSVLVCATVAVYSFVDSDRSVDSADTKSSGVDLVAYRNDSIGIQFSYPSSYTLVEEKDSLPAGITLNIYLSDRGEQSHSISIGTFDNQEELPIEDFLLGLMEKSVVVLLDSLNTNDFSRYEKRDIVVNGKRFQEYQSIPTGQKTLFYQDGSRLVMIDCVQTTGEDTAYGAIAESVIFVGNSVTPAL